MDDYITRPKTVKAVQWDGTKAEMYRIMGLILSHGGDATIEDGYDSQGPDLIVLRDGTRVKPGDYVVVNGGVWFVMSKDEFEKDYDKAPPPPEPPVMRDGELRRSISIQRDEQ